MTKLIGPTRLTMLAVALAGISIFIFVVMMTPYVRTRARLKLLRPEIRSTVAAEQLLRYSTLEIKHVIEYGMIEEGEDRSAQLEKNGRSLDRWRSEAGKALSELRSGLSATEDADATSNRNRLDALNGIEENYEELGRVEQMIRELAMDPQSQARTSAVLQEKFIPLADKVSTSIDQIVQNQISDLQDGVSRLSGILDGIVLYSGRELRVRADSMNAGVSKEIRAGTFVRLFTRSLNNFSEFLLTGDEHDAALIEQFGQESQVLEQWEQEEQHDREPMRSTTLKEIHELQQFTVLFHEYSGRAVGLVRNGEKARAIHFVQTTFEPLVGAPLLETMNELTATEERQLVSDSEFINSKLKRAMGITGGLLLIILIAAISSPMLLSKAYLAALQDINERKKVQGQLVEAKVAAEAASEAKSIFLATMSHEIRTPMNGILGMTELVLDTELTVDQRESLGLVRLSAESLLTIINDILDFSKIEAGKLELEAIPFELRESLGETMKALGFRAHQKGLELIYEVQPDIPETVLGDPGRLRQMIVNLVGNSIKFTEHGENSGGRGTGVGGSRLGSACTSPSGIRGSVFRRTNSKKFLRHFHRPMAPCRESTAAPDWGWPFAPGW